MRHAYRDARRKKAAKAGAAWAVHYMENSFVNVSRRDMERHLEPSFGLWPVTPEYKAAFREGALAAGAIIGFAPEPSLTMGDISDLWQRLNQIGAAKV